MVNVRATIRLWWQLKISCRKVICLPPPPQRWVWKGWHFKLFFVQKLPFVITKITLLQKIHPLLSHSFTALFGGTIIFVEAFSQCKCSWFLIVTTVLQWPHIGDGYLWLELGLHNEFLALFGSIMVIKHIYFISYIYFTSFSGLNANNKK